MHLYTNKQYTFSVSVSFLPFATDACAVKLSEQMIGERHFMRWSEYAFNWNDRNWIEIWFRWGRNQLNCHWLCYFIFFFSPILPAVAIATAVAVAIRNLDSELRISGGVRTNHYRFPNECDVVWHLGTHIFYWLCNRSDIIHIATPQSIFNEWKPIQFNWVQF